MRKLKHAAMAGAMLLTAMLAITLGPEPASAACSVTSGTYYIPADTGQTHPGSAVKFRAIRQSNAGRFQVRAQDSAGQDFATYEGTSQFVWVGKWSTGQFVHTAAQVRISNFGTRDSHFAWNRCY